MLVARPGKDYERVRTRLVHFAHKRKDVWNNRVEAAAYFSRSGWHPQILDMFIVGVL